MDTDSILKQKFPHEDSDNDDDDSNTTNNNISALFCNYRIAATLHTLETWFASGL
jgi:hypothetical protein